MQLDQGIGAISFRRGVVWHAAALQQWALAGPGSPAGRRLPCDRSSRAVIALSPGCLLAGCAADVLDKSADFDRHRYSRIVQPFDKPDKIYFDVLFSRGLPGGRPGGRTGPDGLAPGLAGAAAPLRVGPRGGDPAPVRLPRGQSGGLPAALGDPLRSSRCRHVAGAGFRAAAGAASPGDTRQRRAKPRIQFQDPDDGPARPDAGRRERLRIPGNVRHGAVLPYEEHVQRHHRVLHPHHEFRRACRSRSTCPRTRPGIPRTSGPGPAAPACWR